MVNSATLKAILLDMDGVLFHGGAVLPGAPAFLEAIDAIPHCFVTNNPIRSPQAIADHFETLGLPRPETARIITSAQATADWLVRQKPAFRFYAVGASGLQRALAKYGVEDATDADFVVVGEGAGLDFDTLTVGINLILDNNARLICTNPDPNVDATLNGRHCVLPGGGALVAPFVVATGREPVVIGKPHPLLYQMAIARLGVAAVDCLMVGDRPDTDILGAQRLGMRTALVRSGRFAVGEQLPAGITPDWDCAGLAALLDEWRANGML